MKKRSLFFLAGLSISLLFSLPASGETPSKDATIEVTGQASIMTMPNTVTIMFSVETESSEANQAVRENAERTDKVMSALQKISDKETRIKTSGYALSPVYGKLGSGRTALYRVRNAVIVDSKDLGNVGTFIDRAAEAGVGRISDLVFSVDKPEVITREAASQALRNAIQDAEALAKAAGLSIRRIIKITYDRRDHFPGREMNLAMAPSATPISVGEIQIQASVQVVFELN
jgi:uncharacterized protein YggE